MNDDFENALAWFASAPSGWLESGRKNLEAAAQWIWEVLQGDFNENASTAQVATGTIISMIPFVDQICDIRDLVANCRKINDEPNSSWPWISLVLTLIGLFPAIGSLVKGCLKVMFAALRKGASASGVAPRLDIYVGTSISQLNKFGVWAHWNANGEYVTYTVPPGSGLKVWEGTTASQKLEKTDYIVDGGGTQLVVEPSHFNKSYIGKRQPTEWKYDELGTQNDMVGVPTLKNNFV